MTEPFQQLPQSGYQEPVRTNRPNFARIFFRVTGGIAFLFFLFCTGIIFWATRIPRGSDSALELYSYDAIPLPPFAGRGESVSIESAPGGSRYEITVEKRVDHYGIPGMVDRLWVYIPEGKHAAQTLPCILISPSRIDMSRGGYLDEDETPFHVAFTKAGFVVVAYELGRHPREVYRHPDDPTDYLEFEDACAGLVSSRNALEYSLQKIPEADSRCIFAGGYDGGGTHALLFAEHEPRLAGVMALQPIVDVPASIGALNLRFSSYPEYIDFATRSSPQTHIERLKCPVFIHLNEKKNPYRIVQTAEVRSFVEQLRKQGTDVTLVEAKSEAKTGGGGEAWTASVQWMQERTSK